MHKKTEVDRSCRKTGQVSSFRQRNFLPDMRKRDAVGALLVVFLIGWGRGRQQYEEVGK